MATKADEPDEEAERRVRDLVPTGVVYLMKSGRYYKIGRSNSAGRGAYELAILLPGPLKLVHAIETDEVVAADRAIEAPRPGLHHSRALALADSQRLAHLLGVNGLFCSLAARAPSVEDGELVRATGW